MLKFIINALYYSLASSVFGAQSSSKGAILMLHRVAEIKHSGFSPNAHLSVSPKFLDQLLARLSRDYDFVTLDQALNRVKRNYKKPQRKFLSITLDDGYLDNIENALPIFKKHKVPFTVFVAPGFIEGKATLWWEDLEKSIAKTDSFYIDIDGNRRRFETSNANQKRAVFKDLLDELSFDVSEQEQRRVVAELSQNVGHDPRSHVQSSIATWSQLRNLSKEPLCTIGAHTIDHYMLSKLETSQVRTQMIKSRDIIEAEIELPVKHFAYPYGFERAAGTREFEIAASSGFKTAVTTRHGVVYREHKDYPTALPRISLNGLYQSIRETNVLLSGLPTMLANRGRKLNVD